MRALLDHAAERGASDLHLATGEPAVLRVDGRLLQLGDAVPDVDGMLAALLDGEGMGRLASGGSVDRALALPSGHRFRLAAYRCDQGLAVALRVLRRAAPELGSLHLPPSLDELVGFSHGLVLVVGPTGSGKSTTLAALARRALERRQGVLVTLEDPIEYTFPQVGGALVRQREIGRHVPDFATGLRDALREDPDLMLVGEMRDPESIQLALTAAETGHLVFASLHSRSATSAVERIVDSYPPERQRQIRVQLADALRAVVSQRLLARRDGPGRIPAVEVLRVNRAAAALIRDGKTPQLVSVIQTGGAEGMITLERSLDELVRAGRVHARVARTATEDGHA
ncbi:MAG: PilT/PilU family type 4a pilus ATPase [Alphaproteobacteria bacterium]|nr:PilT/PilU family type 4a pilus ATPase [Alphaproteobacteria bacterium]MCB9695537.1 PilT/PilU family type 4a pilus ATPase [Alphaproteobacteria bacterium]